MRLQQNLPGGAGRPFLDFTGFLGGCDFCLGLRVPSRAHASAPVRAFVSRSCTECRQSRLPMALFSEYHIKSLLYMLLYALYGAGSLIFFRWIIRNMGLTILLYAFFVSRACPRSFSEEKKHIKNLPCAKLYDKHAEFSYFSLQSSYKKLSEPTFIWFRMIRNLVGAPWIHIFPVWTTDKSSATVLTYPDFLWTFVA